MNWWDKDNELIWHPFTQHGLSKPAIPIVGGKNALLWDVNGKEYIDAISSWWVNIWGHANEEIAAAIKEQSAILEQVIFAGFTHQPAVLLAESLLSILPEDQRKVFFSDNGSTSVEVALKMAIQYWHNTGKPRHKIIAFENGYHGDTFGAMSAGRNNFTKAFESFLFEVIQIPVPDISNIESVKEIFSKEVSSGEVAAFIFEPLVQGSGGMLMYEAKYLDELISMAESEGVICIADEVMTGFGRTGKIFACDHLENTPDIFCLSKGITGGFMPLGVTACTQKIYDAFVSTDKMKTFFHGHSYTANPLACSAAVASINILKRSLEIIQQLTQCQHEFSATLLNHAKIENLRQQGTIVAFEVKIGEATGYFNSGRDTLYDHFIERGILLRPLGNTLYILPPYCITREQLQKVYTAIYEVLALID